jgi:hypothetical protein
MTTPQEQLYPENPETKTKICTRKGCPSNGSPQTLDNFLFVKIEKLGTRLGVKNATV